MSFGFSIGDFLAAGQLLAKLIGALKSSTGSSQHYQELISELDNFQCTLLEAEQICLLPSSRSPFQGATVNALKHAIWLCKAPIEKFLGKIENYRARLKKGGSGSRMMDSWRKMGWALFKEEDVRELRRVLATHMDCVQLLVITAGAKSTCLIEYRQEKHQEVIINQIAAQNTALKILRIAQKFPDSQTASGRGCIQQHRTLLGMERRGPPSFSGCSG
ncbi:hypothetical protein K440DRAFT_375341 [Wilcoxina mikolae CBS 423.85]|nr:hypothetical protein K440DRAFT_375341 [Wilcoxina mikolae CBS 423.85]